MALINEISVNFEEEELGAIQLRFFCNIGLCLAEVNPIIVDPTFFERNGAPLCECGEGMECKGATVSWRSL